MPHPDDSRDTNKALFTEMVLMLSTSALQHLGKIINPVTGKTEIHLDAAQATIDMLSMIEAKTRGNLDFEEARLLKNTLASLQMNYVETSQSPAAQQPSAESSQEKSPASTPVSEGTPRPDDKAQKERKFHKTYG